MSLGGIIIAVAVEPPLHNSLLLPPGALPV